MNRKKPTLGTLEKAWRVSGTPNLALHAAIVGRLVDRCMVRGLARHGLNLAQWRAIALLSLARRSTFREIAAYAWLDQGDLSRALRSLESDGIVLRQPNVADRRSAWLALTAKGRRIYFRFRDEWRDFEREFDGLFTESALRAMNAGLEKLAAQCLDNLARERPATVALSAATVRPAATRSSSGNSSAN